MKYTQGQYIIAEKTAIAREIYSFTIVCPEVAAAACPGQFVHIRAKGFTLRRPISICGIDKEKGTLRIVFEIRGEGTSEIAKLNKGELIDMLAPLGHGFTVDTSYNKVILIGGGIGTPPMLPLAKLYGSKAVAISGFRNASAAILQDDFRSTGAETILCTDDGSAGIHGFVTQPLAELAEKGGIDAVYACGPMPMLKAVYSTCNTDGQLSFEERMGCGFGACRGCSCKTITGYKRICTEGPVLLKEEIIW